MDTRFTNDLNSLSAAHCHEQNWDTLTTAERVRCLELDGYVVIPDLLNQAELAAIREEVGRLPTRATDYSEQQRGCKNVETTDSPTAIAIIALPATMRFLETLFGDEVVFCTCAYAVSRPGHPGIAVHTDSQPYGSTIFGLGASCPVLVRVLYYLDDLTPERAPFKVIPRSHLSLHRDGNPYNRFLRHPAERMITCRAGSAAIINQKVFHGNYPNYSREDRRMLAIAYRPAWAGPLADLPEHDPALLDRLPPAVRRLFLSPNTRRIDFDVPNRPDHLATDAPGIDPARWG